MGFRGSRVQIPPSRLILERRGERGIVRAEVAAGRPCDAVRLGARATRDEIGGERPNALAAGGVRDHERIMPRVRPPRARQRRCAAGRDGRLEWRVVGLARQARSSRRMLILRPARAERDHVPCVQALEEMRCGRRGDELSKSRRVLSHGCSARRYGRTPVHAGICARSLQARSELALRLWEAGTSAATKKGGTSGLFSNTCRDGQAFLHRSVVNWPCHNRCGSLKQIRAQRDYAFGRAPADATPTVRMIRGSRRPSSDT